MKGMKRLSQRRCAKCGHLWFPRRWPADRCPECRRRNPSEPLRVATCLECGDEWEARVSAPQRCRTCGAGRFGDGPTVEEVR